MPSPTNNTRTESETVSSIQATTRCYTSFIHIDISPMLSEQTRCTKTKDCSLLRDPLCNVRSCNGLILENSTLWYVCCIMITINVTTTKPFYMEIIWAAVKLRTKVLYPYMEGAEKHSLCFLAISSVITHSRMHMRLVDSCHFHHCGLKLDDCQHILKSFSAVFFLTSTLFQTYLSRSICLTLR
jgi:hypothetical protein